MPKAPINALGFIFVILSGIGFGFLGIFGRLAFQNDLDLGTLLTLRFFIAFILLFIGLILFAPKQIKLAPKQILISLLLGIFGYAIFSTLYFKAIEGISVPLAAMLLFTFPIFVSLGSIIFLKESLNKTQIISLLVASFGILLLLWGPIEIQSRRSILYALAAALCYSAYVLISGKLQKNVAPFSSSLYVILATSIALYFIHQPSLEKINTLNLNQFLIIFGIAIVSTIAPLTLFLAGLQRMPSSQASVIVMIEPVVAAIAAGLLLNETLLPIQLLGAALVIFGVFLNTGIFSRRS